MIEIVVPYDCKGERNLGRAYNEAMRKVDDWACLVDHDVFLKLHPKYMEVMLNAMGEIGYKAGWITCYTNRIGCWWQRLERTKSSDIEEHKRIAEDVYQKNGNTVERMYPIEWQADNKTSLPSGFMILTHKKAWEQAGGFKDGFQGVDNQYALDLHRVGYEFWMMKGLYLYHDYDRRWN